MQQISPKLIPALQLLLAALFFLCLLDMPYSYFQVVRFAALLGFGLMAFEASQRKATLEMIIFIGLALLFQPFLKVALGRTIWNVVDVVVGIGLLAMLGWKFFGKGK